LGFGTITDWSGLHWSNIRGPPEIGMSVSKSAEMSSQFSTAAALMMGLNSVLYGPYTETKLMTACLSLSPCSTPLIWSYPAVVMDPGVFRFARHVHSRSATVIGEPSSHTASGLRLTVIVMAVGPVGATAPPVPLLGVLLPVVLPVVPAAVLPVALPGVVVAAPPAVVADGAVVAAPPPVVPGAAEVAAPPLSSSSPHAAAMATSARPAEIATSRLVRLMLLT